MRFNILVRWIGTIIKNLGARPHIITPPRVKDSYIPEITCLATEEDLIAVRSDDEIALSHACRYYARGEESGTVTRRCLSEVPAPDYRSIDGFLTVRCAGSY